MNSTIVKEKFFDKREVDFFKLISLESQKSRWESWVKRLDIYI